MNESSNRRGKHRRYSDRRIAALLEIHEVLFFDLPGPERTHRLLQTIQNDFETDRAALLIPSAEDHNALLVAHRSGGWGDTPDAQTLRGSGIEALLSVHRQSQGALTLSRFRQPSVFSPAAWDALWLTDLLVPASALLSVPVHGDAPSPLAYLLLALNGTSREWSSHDRDLAEEVAALLFVAINRSQL